MKKSSRRRALTLGERKIIMSYLALGKSRRQIALELNRDHSVISREIRRNNRPHPLMIGYIGHLAQEQAETRKREASMHKRLKNDLIRSYVHEKLAIGWTPEQIAGYLSRDHKDQKISHEAIYQYIYFDYN